MLLPSDSEAHRYVGDIVEELDKAYAFVGEISISGFIKDNKTIYAVEKAIQNSIEACINIERQKDNKGNFSRLFPNFDYAEIKDIADGFRHDYGNLDARLIWNELHGRLRELRNAAEALLETKRTK